MSDTTREPPFWRYCLEFAKEGAARFLSQLDLQAALERGLRRARVPLAFSQGFHPRPRLHFEEALPLGWTSERERVWVDLREAYPAAELCRRLRAAAPAGIRVLRAFPAPGRPHPPAERRYAVNGVALPADLAERLAREFPGAAGEAPPVQFRGQPGRDGGVFLLRPAAGGDPPSLRKVLRALLGEPFPPDLQVRRLA